MILCCCLCVDFLSSRIPTVVAIPPNARVACVDITLPDDSIALEPVRSFSLVIDRITPSSSRVLASVNPVEINIVDNDSELD